MAKKKVAPVVLTHAEQLEKDYLRKRKADEFAPTEPIYQFKVGDKTQWGGHGCCEVVEVRDNGLMVLLKVPPAPASDKSRAARRETWYNWVQSYRVNPWHEKEPQQLSYRDDNRLNFMNSSIEAFYSMVYHFGVDFDASYQRGHVWTEQDRVNLIDSIFNNVEIGKFVFIQLGYGGGKLYEILDGKQRLTTIMMFAENKLKYKGMYYHEMCFMDRNHFDNYSISYARTEEKWDLARKLRYFLKMNTTGFAQTKDHLDKVRKMLADEEKASK